MRGQGRIFQRGAIWWISYYHNGKEIRESTASKDEERAGKLLRKRIREIDNDAEGIKAFVEPKHQRVKVEALLDDLVSDYKIRGKASPDFLYHVKPIRSAFGDLLVRNCTESVIDKTITAWLEDGRAPGTINREMQILGQAFRLAVERKRVSVAPRVRRLPGDTRRQGFFEKDEFEKVVSHLPEGLKDFTRFAFLTGWRKGEVNSLEWSDVDLKGRIIRLRGENSKNGESRKIAIEGEIEKILERRLEQRETITDQGVRSHALVFHRHGEPVKYFRKAWASACKKAGVSGKLFHDLRRTAIRNMVRSGTPESICMQISGHKTRSVFERYNITSENDLREAARRLEGYISSLPSGEHGQNTDN